MPEVAPDHTGRAVGGVAVTALLAMVLGGCDLAYPEVVIVNGTSPQILIRNASFSGCLWATVLELGEATSPGRCLPGEDRVHFEKLDLAAQTPGGAAPLWFRYQTISVRSAGYRNFERFEITLDDLEQDFGVPGPYGH